MNPKYQKYRKHLEGYGLTEAQEEALIHTVYGIMGSFVDRAFGDDPVQQIDITPANDDSQPVRDRVSSRKPSPTAQFKIVARSPAPPKDEDHDE